MSSEDALKVTVEAIMRAPPVTVQFSDNISTTVEKMISYDIGSVIVVSGGAPVGIITERDLVVKIIRPNKDVNKATAREIMSAPLIAIDSKKSVLDALKMMRDRGIRRLAVTRAGSLIGITTERRILEHLAGP